MHTFKVNVEDEDAGWIAALAERMEVRPGVLLRFVVEQMARQIAHSTRGKRGRIGFFPPSPPGILVSAGRTAFQDPERAHDASELVDLLAAFQRALYDRSEAKEPHRRPLERSGATQRLLPNGRAEMLDDEQGDPPSSNTGGSSPEGSPARPTRTKAA